MSMDNMNVTRPRHLVVIGASAGGLELLLDIVSALPAEFPAAIAIVMHTSADSPGYLGHILGKAGPLPCVTPTSSEPLRSGTIYIPPPDFHLLVVPNRICVTKGPKENRFRPAIDPLFRSAAHVYGPNAIGVILSGGLDDGSAGLWAIKRLGGKAIVQDPAEALFPSMPQCALGYVSNVDHVASVADIPELLMRLTSVPECVVEREIPESLAIEVDIAMQKDPLKSGVGRLGEPSPFACPECHGVLLQLKEAGHVRFRCHTGHAYSPESLLAEVRVGIEAQLWNAIRAMQEGDLLMRAMAEHVTEVHSPGDGERLLQRAAELERQVATLRRLVTSAAAPLGST